VRDIEPGDELVYFYPSMQWEMAEMFDCKCGAVDCLGRIGGASQLPAGAWERHLLAVHISSSLIGARRNGRPPSTVKQP